MIITETTEVKKENKRYNCKIDKDYLRKLEWELFCVKKEQITT